MSKQIKLVLLLIGISFLVAMVIIEISKPAPVDNLSVTNTKKRIDLVKLENNYKDNVKSIVNDYQNSVDEAKIQENLATIGKKKKLASTTNEDVLIHGLLDKMPDYRKRLLGQRVPADLKDLHLNLLLTFNKMEDFLTSKNTKLFKESQEMIKIAKGQNSWLNNSTPN
jgi:hypothetical protein